MSTIDGPRLSDFRTPDEIHSRLSPIRRSEYKTLQQRVVSVVHAPFAELVGLSVLFLAGLVNLVDINDQSQVGLDKEVLAKLAIVAACGAYGVWGFFSDGRVRKMLTTIPMVWILLITACFFLAVPGSITPVPSMASACSLLCITLMTVTALIHLGAVRVLTTLFYSLSAFVVLSWLAYLYFPSVGVFAEPLAEGQFQYRMGGLSHPNTLGQFSGLTIVLGLTLYVKFGHVSLFRVGILLLAAGALFGSLSRTSIAATVGALTIVFRRQIFRSEYLLHFVGLLLAIAISLMVVSTSADLGEVMEARLASLSKSGEASELTTATGRVDIWAFTIRKIAERPMTGYGAATSRYHLVDYSSFTHNMVLNVAFSTGVFGGLFMLIMCVDRAITVFTTENVVANGIFAFILINGLFENVMFSFLAGLPTIIWIVAMCLPKTMPDDSVRQVADTDSEEVLSVS